MIEARKECCTWFILIPHHISLTLPPDHWKWSNGAAGVMVGEHALRSMARLVSIIPQTNNTPGLVWFWFRLGESATQGCSYWYHTTSAWNHHQTVENWLMLWLEVIEHLLRSKVILGSIAAPNHAVSGLVWLWLRLGKSAAQDLSWYKATHQHEITTQLLKMDQWWGFG